MSDVTEDLRILYRAVSRRPGPSREIAYAGCVTAEEAVRLKQMGVARIVDVQTAEEMEEAEEGQKVGAGESEREGEGEREGEEAAAATTSAPARSDWIRVSLAATAADDAEGATALPAALRLEAADHEMLMFLSRSAEASHAAATLAAQAGFYCVLNILDGRERYRSFESG